VAATIGSTVVRRWPFASRDVELCIRFSIFFKVGRHADFYPGTLLKTAANILGGAHFVFCFLCFVLLLLRAVYKYGFVRIVETYSTVDQQLYI
jgi:hypothetical protein